MQGKKILIGITGSIAAYKVAMLVRLLVKQGAEVKVIMSESATAFITPLTLATLSKNPVLIDFQASKETGEWNNHVELGLWADVFIIAPATANSLAKCALGLCDNLLTAVYLSARCPVMFAPAMDLDMYRHPSTLANIGKLQSYGNLIIPATHGELASGLVGEGRMAEPEDIVAYLQAFFNQNLPLNSQLSTLNNKTVLLTAGPTQEALDPVRFISNHSTGKMGYALAEAFAEAGAKVILVTGVTNLKTQHPDIQRVDVRSAAEMYEASQAHFAQADIIVLAAAVADYTPKTVAKTKIKKKEGENDLTLELVKTVDIAKTLGEQKQASQLMIGFALETDNELENAKGKLQRKNLDLIVLNSLRTEGAGFGHDTNAVTLLNKAGELIEIPLQSKQAVAKRIVAEILKIM
ncbi:MAG: bifunctional phosphopantothenoylcysteine decarboxylase/phosphopantothenate--cysteine ligase CoaBC [Bacteroidetes bacterium]|nr:MAG: bifunctional phosphopantothenoylcysteine decarboxylase/phosphopantothenate--cysteine ligase CoaBC [Bacteroidota bacterium]